MHAGVCLCLCVSVEEVMEEFSQKSDRNRACSPDAIYHLAARIIILYLTLGLCGQLGFVNISLLYVSSTLRLS